QSARMDWLIRATAALAGTTGRCEGSVEVARAVRDACDASGADLDGDSDLVVPGDESRVRLAVEALLVSSESPSVSLDGDVLEIRSSGRDRRGGGRTWKLDLARRVLHAEGFGLRVRSTQ